MSSTVYIVTDYYNLANQDEKANRNTLDSLENKVKQEVPESFKKNIFLDF